MMDRKPLVPPVPATQIKSLDAIFLVLVRSLVTVNFLTKVNRQVQREVA
jgi:hypothetical protein